MRSEASIIADPEASPEEIRELENLLDRLRHPNCPLDDWMVYAATWPDMAIHSPLYPLLLLENPSLEDSLFCYAEQQINELIFALDYAAWHSLAVQYAEAILPYLQNVDRVAMTEAIRLRRLYAYETISRATVDALWKQHWAAWNTDDLAKGLARERARLPNGDIGQALYRAERWHQLAELRGITGEDEP